MNSDNIPRQPELRSTSAGGGHEEVVWGEIKPDKNTIVAGSQGSASVDPGAIERTPEVYGFVERGAKSADDRSSGRLQAGSIWGADDRRQITDTAQIPWRQICCLQIKFPRGVRIGSGTLIGVRTVLTAGHCVFEPELGGGAEEIIVTPGRSGPVSGPFGFVAATHFKATRGWVEQDAHSTVGRLSSPFDYAAILLPTDLGGKPGWMAFGSLATGSLVNRRVNHAGYPIDNPSRGTTQWWNANDIENVTSDRLYYHLDTFDGESGGPLWIYDLMDQTRVIVGIHTAFVETANSGLRITEAVLANLQRWQTVV